MIPLMMGSSCQLDATMDRVRDVHSGVVASFRGVDDTFAPMFADAGEICISQAREDGLEGEEAREDARSCMETSGWFTIEEALSTTREALAELEQIYNDIENGRDRYSEWQSVAERLLAHGRRLATAIDAAGLDVPDDLMSTLDAICNMTDCEGD
jgi:hypothetical protein